MVAAVTHTPPIHLVAENAVVRQARALRTYHWQLNSALDREGVSPLVWPALLLLYERPSASPEALADAMAMPVATTLRWLNSIEEGGLIGKRDGGYFISGPGKRAVEQVIEGLA